MWWWLFPPSSIYSSFLLLAASAYLPSRRQSPARSSSPDRIRSTVIGRGSLCNMLSCRIWFCAQFRGAPTHKSGLCTSREERRKQKTNFSPPNRVRASYTHRQECLFPSFPLGFAGAEKRRRGSGGRRWESKRCVCRAGVCVIVHWPFNL